MFVCVCCDDRSYVDRFVVALSRDNILVCCDFGRRQLLNKTIALPRLIINCLSVICEIDKFLSHVLNVLSLSC